MLIQKRKPIFDERYSDNGQLFTWSTVVIFLIFNSFVTLFKHNFTNLSKYSKTYLNGLQNDILLNSFGFLFELKPQLIFHSYKICWVSLKSKKLIYMLKKKLN